VRNLMIIVTQSDAAAFCGAAQPVAGRMRRRYA
jgi:hypothetical protein